MRTCRIVVGFLLLVLLVPSASEPRQAPAAPPAAGMTVFLYYKDIEPAVRFYRDVLGLRATVDKAPIHVFQLTPSTAIGLVDSKTARGGASRPSADKPLTVTFVVDDIDRWYQYLIKRGVAISRPPRVSSNLNVSFFLFNDPEGYELEVMSWQK